MRGTGRGVLTVVAALLLPACNLTYSPDLVAPGNSAPPPPPFILLVPLDGEIQALTNPQFAWNALSGAASYQLQVSTTSDFTGIVWDRPALTITSTFMTQVTLTNFTTYYWRVFGVQAGGGKVLAGGSPFQFRTQGGAAPIPLAFSTQNPGNGMTGVPVLPDFSWQASIGAISYRIEIDLPFGTFTPPLFVQPNIHVNRFAWTTPLAANTQYQWRVIATGQAGDRISSIPPDIFRTAP